MSNTITYNGKSISSTNINIIKGNIITETLVGKNINFVLNDINISLNSKTITVIYNKSIDIDGDEIVNKLQIPIVNSSKYDYFYDTIYSGKIGTLVTKSALNTITQFIYGDDCILYNPLNNYEEIQPITFSLDTTQSGVTVTIVDSKLGSDLVYSLDNGITELPLVETEIPLISGSYTIIITEIGNSYPFAKDFTIDDI